MFQPDKFSELLDAPVSRRRVAPKHYDMRQRLVFHSEPGENGCRNWISAADRHGYGFIALNGKQQRAPYGVQVFNANSGRMVEMPPPIAQSEHPVLAVAICIAALKARAAIAKATP